MTETPDQYHFDHVEGLAGSRQHRGSNRVAEIRRLAPDRGAAIVAAQVEQAPALEQGAHTIAETWLDHRAGTTAAAPDRARGEVLAAHAAQIHHEAAGAARSLAQPDPSSRSGPNSERG